ELYLCAVQELSRYPELVEDVLKLQRWTEILHCPKAVFRPSDEAVFCAGSQHSPVRCEPSELDSLVEFVYSCFTRRQSPLNLELVLPCSEYSTGCIPGDPAVQSLPKRSQLLIGPSRSQLSMDTETSPSHLQTKAYVRQLQVIDNQNLLFDMSCKLEPKDT
ncbi:rap guanine nucleotide exchange factor-like 1, partial [Lates japonicus]